MRDMVIHFVLSLALTKLCCIAILAFEIIGISKIAIKFIPFWSLLSSIFI